MSDWASLNGQRIVSAEITIPWYGAWVADVVLPVPTAIPSGILPLVFADVTLMGTVYRQSSFAGSRSARLVGGFGGWLKTISARAYQNPIGVPLSMVFGDAAGECGEVIATASQIAIAGQTVGAFFTRQSAPGVRVLNQLTNVWWIDSTGKTQVIDRTTVSYTGTLNDSAHLGAIGSAFSTIEWSGGKGRFTVASEVLSDWMPGRTFTDPNVTTPQTISLVVHTLKDDGHARTEVLATP